MAPRLVKSVHLVVLFAAISLLTYISFHGRWRIHPEVNLLENEFSYSGSRNTTPILLGDGDQLKTIAEGKSPDTPVLSPLAVSEESNEDSFKASRTSKILQAVMLAGDLQTSRFERMLATHEAHSKRWGYRVQTLRRFIRGHGDWDQSIFSKPLYVLQLLITEMGKPDEERAEWIVWYDSDTIILNPNIPWELFLPPSDFSDIYMIGTRDWLDFNCGVFFVRVNEWSINLFTETAAMPLLKPEVDLEYNRDQTAMRIVLEKSEYQQHFLYQPIHWFNSFYTSKGHLPEVIPGDLLVHFAGRKATKQEAADSAMDLWLERAENESGRWALPLENTSYPTDVEAYWSRIGQARQLSEKTNVTLQKYNDTGMSGVSQTETALLDLRSKYSALQTVLNRTPFSASKMSGAISDTTMALEQFQNSENLIHQPNQPARRPKEQAASSISPRIQSKAPDKFLIVSERYSRET